MPTAPPSRAFSGSMYLFLKFSFLPSYSKYVVSTFFFQPLVKFRSHLYYEEKDQVAETLKQLHPLQGSKIVFFKNGQCQGDAFLDIYAGAYYPAVSLYKSCSVVVNFGPDFEHPPPKEQYSYRGVSTCLCCSLIIMVLFKKKYY